MRILPTPYGARLTSREIEVFDFIKAGLRSREIAERLEIAESTVFNHRKNILKKKGLKRLNFI